MQTRVFPYQTSTLIRLPYQLIAILRWNMQMLALFYSHKGSIVMINTDPSNPELQYANDKPTFSKLYNIRSYIIFIVSWNMQVRAEPLG